VDPYQRDFKTLIDVIDWITLWRTTNVVRSSGDPPMDHDPFICQEDWIGLKVHLKDLGGMVVLLSRINYYRLDDHFEDRILGKDYVGVTLLDVFVGNKEAIMTHVWWPLLDFWFPNGRS